MRFSSLATTLLLALLISSAAAQQQVIEADAVTTLREAEPGNNFGDAPDANVWASPDGEDGAAVTLLRFSGVADVPRRVTGAELVVYVIDHSAITVADEIVAYDTNHDGWEEADATWNTENIGPTSPLFDTPVATHPQPNATAPLPIEIVFASEDLAALVEEWRLGSPASGIMLAYNDLPGHDGALWIASNYHADPALRPQLRIWYDTPSEDSRGGCAARSEPSRFPAWLLFVGVLVMVLGRKGNASQRHVP